MQLARAAILTLISAAALGAEVPTIRQSIEVRRAVNPTISPSGRYVAFHVSEANWKSNEFVRQIWIHDAVTGRSYQLTAGPKSADDPKWSPDEKRILFSSSRDGDSKLFTISPFGGEAQPLTDGEMAARSYEWSPDGKRIAFVSVGARKDETLEKRSKKYGSFDRVDRDYRMSHLWLIDVPDVVPGDPEQLPKPSPITSGEDYTVGSFAWSPDGKRIAFHAAEDPDLDNVGTADLYVVRLSDQGVSKIVDSPGPDTNPVWSPDGKRIAFSTAAGSEYFFYTNREIAVVPSDGGEARVLTGSFDEDARLVDWGPQGVYFHALDKTRGRLYRMNPDTGDIERLPTGDGSAFAASFSADFQTMALDWSLVNGFHELVVSSVGPFEPKRFTENADQFAQFELATREIVSWESQDGTRIDGVLWKPADFDESHRYPLLVAIHGGPTGISMPYRSADRIYPLEMFAAKGALVLQPNYRGSAGYGQGFRALNVRNLGIGDAWDVVSGVDHLVAQGIADPDRVGAMGWSQGGYISAFLTCSSDRFRAISVGAGISDWMTYYVNTDIHPFTRMYLKATPWEDPEIYRKTSPISYVDQAQTPTLIQHGDNDQRVPLPNAFELYQALRDRGVPVDLVVYKGFGHGINKPKEMMHVMQQNYDWFSKHIWDELPTLESANLDDEP